MKNLFKRKPRRTLSEVSAEFAKKVPLPPNNTIDRKIEMTRQELLNQVAEKLERCEYTPIVTEKEEMQIWAMLLNEVYEEIFNTK